MIFTAKKNALVAQKSGETLRIEGWGRDSLRVRAVMYDGWTGHDWALTEKPEASDCTVRIGTVKNADRIVVLDEGRAVGIGTHEELMRSCSVYREIALSQLSPEELEVG